MGTSEDINEHVMPNLPCLTPAAERAGGFGITYVINLCISIAGKSQLAKIEYTAKSTLECTGVLAFKCTLVLY